MDERHPHAPPPAGRPAGAPATRPGRVPPADLDAEAAVLSCCLLRPQETIAEIEPLLKPPAFYSDANRRIYQTILDLDDEGVPVDLVSVAERLRTQNRLQQIGGTPYLAQICDATPAIQNVVAHAKLVAEKHRLRLLIAEAQLLSAEGYGDVGDIPTFLQNGAERIFQIADGSYLEDTLVSIKDAAEEELAALTKRREKGTAFDGLSTGLDAIDRMLLGLKRGSYYMIGARPGHGKTALAIQISRAVAGQRFDGKRQGVVYVSPEMPRATIVQRHIAHVSGVPITKLRLAHMMDAEDWQRVSEAAQIIGRLPVEIDDRPVQNVAGVRAAARRGLARLRRRYNDPELELGLVVLDYIQLMVPHSEVREATYAQLLGDVSVGLRRMFREIKCAGLVLSQLNRNIESRPKKDRRPQLSDLRDSGSLEQDAFGIMFLYRADQYLDPGETPDNKAEVVFAKHTQGPTGTATLDFVPDVAAFLGEKRSEEIPPDAEIPLGSYGEDQ